MVAAAIQGAYVLARDPLADVPAADARGAVVLDAPAPAPADAPAGAATAVPHSLQNRAPLTSRLPQERQVGAASEVPHSLQNFPVARAPHDGHDVEAEVESIMIEKCVGTASLYTRYASPSSPDPRVHVRFMNESDCSFARRVVL